MQKKGVTDVHFNWIFILIAGAVIFMFFITIVNKQRAFSEVKVAQSLVVSLDAILTGAEVSTRTVNIIKDLPKADIGFECNNYFVGGIPRDTGGSVIFAPSVLKGRRIIAWAVDWKMPFKVANFLYLTHPEVRYIIVNDTSSSANLAQKLFDELPKELNKEIVAKDKIGDIIDKNNYKVKFIFFNDNIQPPGVPKLKDMPFKDVTAISLPASGIIASSGELSFWEKNKVGAFEWIDKGDSFYIEKESLYGAIFAENKDTYDCVMRKAFDKLSYVSRVYRSRSSELGTFYRAYPPKQYCANYHVTTEFDNTLVPLSTQLAQSFPTTMPEITSLKEAADNIEQQNQKASLKTCALVY
ncbi:MAG TPA: hypothetical protein VFF28_00860 [Candidatus Nanoarchaeia archaeon]|nr:hypothetical protein [Candidatus Nanoarchaeia archaeon]